MHKGKKLILIIEVFLALLVARLCVIILPFKKIAHWMENSESVDFSHNEGNDIYLAVLSSYIRKVSGMFGFNCFAKALAGKYILNRRKVRSTINFGVMRDANNDVFKAHAWLVTNGDIITGKKDHDKFTLLKSFT